MPKFPASSFLDLIERYMSLAKNKVIQFLLIEDDPDDQEIFCMALQKIDKTINCVIANDAIEAIASIKATDRDIPDYIFIDVNMPKMNGIECLRELRNFPRLSKSNIVMYSTTSEERLMNVSKELGADFIIKPTSLSNLVEILSNILQHKGK